MDDYVKSVLAKWGLADLIPRFKEEQIDRLAFNVLNDAMIKELIPRIGRRAIFRHKYIELKTAENKHYKIETENQNSLSEFYIETVDGNELTGYQEVVLKNDSSGTESIEAPVKKVRLESVDLLRILNEGDIRSVEEVHEYEAEEDDDDTKMLVDHSREDDGLTEEAIIEEDTTVQIYEVTQLEEQAKPAQDLRAVLQESVLGRSLLEKKTLTSVNRSLLSDLIVQHLLNKSPDFRIRTVEFLYWANAIKLVFPYEAAETYYQPYKRDANSCARGKLFDKYHHVRRTILSKSKRTKILESLKQKQIKSTGSQDLEALKTVKGLVEAKELWAKTYNERIDLLAKLSINEYFEHFAILKTYNGIALMKQDFERNYVKSKDNLTEKWSQISKKIIRFGQSKIPEMVTQFQEDEMDIENHITNPTHYAFIFLFFLLSVRKVPKTNWIPNRIEMIQSCFLYSKTFPNLQKRLNDRKEKLANHGLSFLPLVGAIGPSFGDLQRCFIIINNIFYEFPTLMEAIDSCFKIFIALRSEYPPEGVNFWSFIQKFVYNVDTPWDKGTVVIYNLWTELEQLDVEENSN